MPRLSWLREEQVARICPFFGQEQGVKRVDDREVLSGIIHGTRRGLCRVNAPAADGPHTTLYNCFRRWSDKGVFDLIFSELSASDATEPSDAAASAVLRIDATHRKAHPTTSGLNKGGMTSRLHGACCSKGRPRRCTCVRGNAVTSPVLMGC